MAPEAFDPEEFGGLGPAADVWATGCCLLEMLSGAPPWNGERHQVISRKVCDKRLTPPIPASVAEPISSLLAKCFNYQPASRPCARELCTSVKTIVEQQREMEQGGGRASAPHSSFYHNFASHARELEAKLALLSATDGVLHQAKQSEVGINTQSNEHGGAMMGRAEIDSRAAVVVGASAHMMPMTFVNANVHERRPSECLPEIMPDRHEQPNIVHDPKLQSLMDMGFDRAFCEAALEITDRDMRKAALLLCEQLKISQYAI